MTNDNLKNNLEALLYFFNEPVSFKKLAKLINRDTDEVRTAIEDLQQNYRDRGLRIVISNSEAQLVGYISDEDLLDQLDQSKENSNLTPAVLETLAVVLYLGEADEATIDAIRGVRSSRTIKKLTRRGYLEKDADTYTITAEAKKQLGFEHRNQLPSFDTLQIKLRDMAHIKND